jgi:hypothetical protein
MNEKGSISLISASAILVLIMTPLVASFLTPWQLFQQLCPYFGAQSPQCAMLQQQQQQQQQALSSSPYTAGGTPSSSSSSSSGDPFSSSSAAPSP